MGQSISAQLYQMSKDYPIIPFALGIAAGHIWWPNVPGK